MPNLSSPNLAPISPEIQSIKTKVFIFMVICVVGAFIYAFAKLLLSSYNFSEQFIGFHLIFVAMYVVFIAYSVLYTAMKSMSRMAKSVILSQSFFIFFLVVIVMNTALFLRGLTNGVVSTGLLSLITICCFIYSLFLRYEIYKEVAYITNQPLFMYAFWLIITLILSPIGILLYIIAWIRVREIRQSTSAEEYNKFRKRTHKHIDFSKSNDMDTQPIKSNAKYESRYMVLLTMVGLLFICIVGFTMWYLNNNKVNTQRFDEQIATYRSDLASAQKAIVAKVFADDIDTTQSFAPDPNKSVRDQNGNFNKKWGDWIMEVAGLDYRQWKASGNGIYAIDNSKRKRKACYDKSALPLLWINPRDGTMNFNPSRLSDNYYEDGFCEQLMMSYESSGYNGDKVIPLASTGTVK